MSEFPEAVNRPAPTMAVVFTGKTPFIDTIGEIASIKPQPVAELRADTFESYDRTYLAGQVKKLSAMPVIFTARRTQEDGKWRGTEEERVALLTEPLLPEYDVVDAVDLELATEGLADAVKAVHDRGKLVIVSIHHLLGTPPTQGLMRRELESAYRVGADYFKLAAKVTSDADFERQVEFAENNHDVGPGLIVVPMGTSEQRIKIMGHGSLLGYASATETPVATGQLWYPDHHEHSIAEHSDYAALAQAA